MRKFFTAIFLLFTAWLLQSCQLTRHLEDGQHLVVKTQIHLNGNNEFEYKADPYSLETALKQKSYRKIFFINILLSGIVLFSIVNFDILLLFVFNKSTIFDCFLI